MKRREVLKSLGLSVGYVIAVPSALSILHSCNTKTSVWNPTFLTIEEGIILKNLVDIILPKTENLPGALDVNVPEFIDLYVYKAYDKREKEEFKLGLASIMMALNVFKREVSELNSKDYDNLLSKYLKADRNQLILFLKDKEDSIILKALQVIRKYTIWAYKTSEQVGKNILAYDPIPSIQMGCVLVEDVTGGRAWSL
ncbi:gluconate 2-dehydrogenase subunit 3 family protein [uncultured Polaribacter sp.]|uniref:gluconate 2-dehydrogenase subunit 3 family protein n=1 Tax=uncultured Polaribacter sp. TaxID=174711 RepID=UPI0026333321|nr:gluconate 2-dehydrogenase subunit 3 family protein [uncultured Polaribacter sp.]